MRFTGSQGGAARRAAAQHPPPPPEQKIERALELQEAISRVLSHGCADCFGKLYCEENSTRIRCGRTIEGAFEPHGEEAVRACRIPQMYAQLMAGARDDASAEEVLAARPGGEGE